MASGCILRPKGKRGVVIRIKYTDSTGRQIMETLGREKSARQPDGVVSYRDAQRELRERLGKVDRGWSRPKPLTFSTYADAWFDEGERRRHWKPRTVVAYKTVLERLTEFFGPLKLEEIRPRHVAKYIAEQSKVAENGEPRFAPATISRDVSILASVFKTAVREELIESNPATGAERPRIRQKRWRILKPEEVGPVARAFTNVQARTVFLTLVLTGVRRHELQALRWRDVDLVENVLRVRDSKSEDGIRAIALAPTLAEELWQQRRRSNFQGDDELVFCHQERGTTYRASTFAPLFQAALTAAGVDGHLRPFHDLRHTAITHDAASGSSPIAVMTKAGHADFKTTKRYMHLAGVVFREEAAALERRLLGPVSTEPSTDLESSQDVSGSPGSLNDAGSRPAA